MNSWAVLLIVLCTVARAAQMQQGNDWLVVSLDVVKTEKLQVPKGVISTHGVVTLRHLGNIYKAGCTISQVLHLQQFGPSQRDDRMLKGDTVKSSLPILLKENTTELGGNLKTSLKLGVGLGVGICTTIVAFEPYLAPAWPVCSGITSLSLVTTFAGLNLTKYVIADAAVTVGSVYYCAKNEIF